MTDPFISVMGNIGSGKTTLDKCIAKHLKFHLIEENVANNQFLADFYKDMHRWAFHSQTYYLTEKIKQMLEIKKILLKKPVVQDTSIYQDVFVFAEAQYEAGNMSQPEFDLYQKIYAMWEGQLPTPNLIIYLKTSVEVVEKRINKRARSFEDKVPRWYLVLLNWLLERWVEKNGAQATSPEVFRSGRRGIPVLTIETDGVNIVENKKDIEKVIELIKKKL